MKKWILCLPEDNALVKRIRTEKNVGGKVEINKESNLLNLENIQEGDLVFVYTHEENTSKFHEESEVSMILEKDDYKDSKTGITRFKVKELNN